MLDILREEKKYEVSLTEMAYVKSRLEAVLRGDSVNGTKTYLVRSLYFDSISDVDYFEKEAGVSERKKIRIRVYSPDSKVAKLELKAKSGGMQRKQSLTISKEDATEMIHGNYEVLKNYKDDLAGYLYRTMTMEMYLPRCVVEYDRIAFRTSENDIRITLDSGVRANEGNFDIFSDKLMFYPVMNPCKGVVEVKYNRFLLSYVKDILQGIDKVETSVSKYCMSRKYGLGGE